MGKRSPGTWRSQTAITARSPLPIRPGGKACSVPDGMPKATPRRAPMPWGSGRAGCLARTPIAARVWREGLMPGVGTPGSRRNQSSAASSPAGAVRRATPREPASPWRQLWWGFADSNFHVSHSSMRPECTIRKYSWNTSRMHHAPKPQAVHNFHLQGLIGSLAGNRQLVDSPRVAGHTLQPLSSGHRRVADAGRFALHDAGDQSRQARRSPSDHLCTTGTLSIQW